MIRLSALSLFVCVSIGAQCTGVIESDNTIDESVAVEVEIGELFCLQMKRFLLLTIESCYSQI